MARSANLFGVLNETIVLLLGALLVLIAVTRPVMLPARPAALVVLGAFLIFWGVRAWARPGSGAAPGGGGTQRAVRALSLGLVGAAVMAIPFLPLRDSGLALGSAGVVLAIRGALGAIANARMGLGQRAGQEIETDFRGRKRC
ncbi:MAG: hypothetical protein WBS18_07195 [Candidatus Acidiferrales bacterium]